MNYTVNLALSGRRYRRSMPRHMAADFGEIGFAGAGFIDELAVEHHDQAIRQFQQLIEILADQEHRGATVARGHDLGMNLRDRGEVEPEAGIGRDQDLDQKIGDISVLYASDLSSW